jgi:tetratricopeptide (TPR) repeat protein
MNMSFYTILLRPLRISNIFIPIFIVLFFCFFPVFSYPVLSGELHDAVLSVMDLVYQEQFDNARNDAKKIIRKFPDEPAGYFVMAYATDAWMEYHQSDKYENEFYRYCDQVIEKGEKKLSEPNASLWNKFFVGGADGFKGTYEARYERWITAFRFGWKGVAVLLEIEKSGTGIPDIYFGIGCYSYWRSAMMKMLWWMPGVEDKREDGIRQLFQARDSGVYTSVAASLELIDILINEKRFKEAGKIADEGMEKYPEFSAFKWGRAQALAGMREYDKSIMLTRQIIEKYEKNRNTNHYNTILYYLHIANTYLAQKKYVQAIATCNELKSYKLDGKTKKRLNATFDEVKKILKRAMSGLKRK